jgi:hypothetical protein
LPTMMKQSMVDSNKHSSILQNFVTDTNFCVISWSVCDWEIFIAA